MEEDRKEMLTLVIFGQQTILVHFPYFSVFPFFSTCILSFTIKRKQ